MTTWQDGPVTVYIGDALSVLREMPTESVHCVVTSPPYWGLRDYGVEGQLGLEATPDEYVARMVEVFAEVRRVLRSDGTLWLNMGDGYANTGGMTGGTSSKDGGAARVARMFNGGYRPLSSGLKPKDLIGMPWRLAFALQADGWWLRSDIVWSKPNPMPESVTDRPTKAHEYVFLLTKSARYYFDAEAVREPDSGQDHSRSVLDDQPSLAPPGQMPHRGIRTLDGRNGTGRNLRSVWTIATQPYPEAHFATFPEALVIPCIKAGTSEGGTVFDPFAGSGTVLAVARRLGRQAVGIELQAEYLPLIQRRVSEAALPLLEMAGA